jgi:hypothetical protein
VTHVGYLVAGYGLTAAVLVGYVLRLRSRSRALARSSAGPASAADGATDAPTP